MPEIKARAVEPQRAQTTFTVTTGRIQRAKRAVIYGPGGVGKTTAAAGSPSPLIIDLEGGSSEMNVARLTGLKTWEELLAALRDQNLTDPFQTVFVDSGTRAEEFALDFAKRTIPCEGGRLATSIESWAYGKGPQYVYDVFLQLLAELDRLIERGKNVGLICHECVNDTPNPSGEDFLRYEPRLQSPKSGKASIRDRVFEWADVVGYLSYDVLSQDGKARGSGTRTLYFDSRPTWRAKGRGNFVKAIPWNDPTKTEEIWQCLR